MQDQAAGAAPAPGEAVDDLRGLVPRPRQHPGATVPAGFTAALAGVQQRLRAEGIPFVIIGSLACAAWTGQDALARFDRPGAFGTRRYPDIDMLVPRAAVAAVARHARGARSSFPVAVDLSGASCFIDLRPGSDVSYLTHRRLRFPVPSRLFTPCPARAAGTGVTTIDPRVLLHAFGTVGGIIRRKDEVGAYRPAAGKQPGASQRDAPDVQGRHRHVGHRSFY